MKKKPFDDIPAQTDFIKNEHRLLRQWRKSGLVKKYLDKNKGGRKRFSFIDGPITANNPMGVHHAWGRTLKDLYQRYKNMQGFAQRFQNGFDCQGLWVEVEVEKEKGFKNKKDIENYGIDRFVESCKARVNKYAQIQTRQSIRLGYFMDWDNSYFTMSEENNYAIWHFLKRCWEKDSIYKGNDTVPWCPRCGTAISQQEVAEGGHRQTTHPAVFMRFPVVRTPKTTHRDSPKAGGDEFLLVWTTTPWTIPANTLVAVGPKIKYALVEFEGKKYWLAQSLIIRTFGKNLKPIKVVSGKELIEKEKISHYRAPFDNLPLAQKIGQSGHFHALVVSKDLVNEEEGTGLVHIVPGAGGEDYQLVQKELGWEEIIFPVVDEEGGYVEGYGFLSGKNAKNKPELVIGRLKRLDGGLYFFKTESYTHPYPVCWRCKTELIWRLVDEWYINMDQDWGKGVSLRERMVKIAKQINWHPSFGLKRELDWLANMGDWMISKKRYWGLALPIWECKNGHFEVIGSREELKKRATAAPRFAGHTPHRPWIDKIKIKCPQCGREMSRIPDVGNPWLDAGIVPFSTLTDPKTKKPSYLGDKKYWRSWYPADFITESFPGQFRNWFYSLIAMAAGLENKPSFKTVLGYALVRDEKGKEIHKSAGNAIWFDEGAEKIGVDTMRWLYARQDPKANLNFGYRNADEVRRQYLFLFWNTYRFFVTYANLNGFQPPKRSDLKAQKSKQILDRWIISRLESTKQTAEKKLDTYAHHEAMAAIEEFLADLSRWYVRRCRERVSPNNPDTQDRNACLNTLYYVLTQLSLVLAPFIPFLTETVWQNLVGGSVHLQNWPKVKKEAVNRRLENQMKRAREVVELGHAARKQEGIKTRQPLGRLKVYSSRFKIDKKLTTLLQEELNIKEIVIATDTAGREGEKSAVELETKLTPALIAEGEARQLIRQIQILRREEGLSISDRITITAPAWPKKWEDRIKQKTGAVEIKKGEKLKICRL